MSHVYGNYEDYFRKIIVEEDATENFLLLKELRKLDMKLQLVTTCRKHYLDILFDEHNLNAMFECIGAREDVLLNELKPHLRAYLIALKQMVLDAKKVLSLEYSKREIDAVIEAGVPIIKVDPFTKIKYHDKKCIEEKSTNKASKMILK